MFQCLRFKRIVEVTKIISHERIQQRTVEEIFEFPVQQIMENIVEVVQIIPQERVSERVVEQIVDRFSTGQDRETNVADGNSSTIGQFEPDGHFEGFISNSTVLFHSLDDV